MSDVASLEWDETKRWSNLDKHGLDFRDAGCLLDGRMRIDAPASFAAETRTVTVGIVHDVFVTLVWTRRGSSRRIISFRRARHEERRAYQERFG